MENSEETKVIIIDKNGKVLCISTEDGVTKIVPKDFEEVSLDNLFIFWDKDIESFKEYLDFHSSLIYGIKSDGIDIDSCSFLDLHVIDEDEGTFLIE